MLLVLLVVLIRPAARGRATHCSSRTVLGIVGRDGAFAEYLVLPEENLHREPKEIDTDAATFVEPLAAALAIQQQVTIRPDYKVLLLGDGKLGQLIAQTLALTGCELLGWDATRRNWLYFRGGALRLEPRRMSRRARLAWG
jgi:threonine dehydrogenase-like Zn-dependent dehydrogenase